VRGIVYERKNIYEKKSKTGRGYDENMKGRRRERRKPRKHECEKLRDEMKSILRVFVIVISYFQLFAFHISSFICDDSNGTP
jgi:hypothetical protein